MAVHTTENSFGAASVILGIVGIALALFSSPVAGIALGIVGLVFSYKQEKYGKNRWSKSGRILGIVSIAVAVFVIIVFVAVGSYLAQNPLAVPSLEGLQ
jgi:hypothetical protein